LDAAYRRLLRYYRPEFDRLAADLAGELSIGIAQLDLSRVTWIAATLVRNSERNLRRRLKLDQHQSDHEELGEQTPDGTTPISGRLLEADLERMLGPKDAAIVIAVVLRREPQGELAIRMNMPYDAVRKRYQRALRRLRQEYS